MNFKIQCTTCWQATKHDALESGDNLVCDKCGAKL